MFTKRKESKNKVKPLVECKLFTAKVYKVCTCQMLLQGHLLYVCCHLHASTASQLPQLPSFVMIKRV